MPTMGKLSAVCLATCAVEQGAGATICFVHVATAVFGLLLFLAVMADSR